jgi:hypothetical protein
MPVQLLSNLSEEDVVIGLTGDLLEKEKFPEMKLRLSQRVVMDCEGLRHISSYAIMQWSRWMKSFDPRQQFVFRNLPPRAVDILNLVDDFLPTECTIENFYVPYECQSCDHEELYLARRGKEYLETQAEKAAILRLPTEINCPKCKNGMTMGVWQSKFLRFLEKRSNK